MNKKIFLVFAVILVLSINIPAQGVPENRPEYVQDEDSVDFEDKNVDKTIKLNGNSNETSKEIWTGHGKGKIDGYIIQLREKSILEKKFELEYEIKELEKEIEDTETRGISAIYDLDKKKFKQQLLARKKAEFSTKIKDYRRKLVLKREDVKRDINKILGKDAVENEFENVFNGLSLDISKDEAEELLDLLYVENIYENTKVKITLSDSVPLINADDVWDLGYTGSGIQIAILDTGVDYTHTDLGGCFGSTCKVVDGYDFVNNDADPMDDHGHGTHVAAIAAGDGTLKGVAHKASIYAYKVLDSLGFGYSDDIIAAIDRAVDPNQDGNYADHVDVISMSLGGIGDPNDPLSQAVDNAANNGVVVVVSAGNSGPDPGTISSPGTARKAITVGATDKSDLIASFSSRGPVSGNIIKPDILAPGVSICAAQWDNWLPANQCLDTEHITIGGTSMSAPHVSGVAALILNKYSSLEPDKVKAILMQTAIDTGYDVYTQGTGKIDALIAISTPALATPNSFELGINQNINEKSIPFDITIESLDAAAYTFDAVVTTSSSNIIASIPAVLTIGVNQATITFTSISGNLNEDLYTGVIILQAREDPSILLRLLYTLTIDFTPPIISNVGDLVILEADTFGQEIKWNTDDISDNTLFYRKIGSAAFLEAYSSGTGHSFDVSSLESGDYEYFITATNMAGLTKTDNNNGNYYKITVLLSEPIPKTGFSKVSSLAKSRDILTKMPEIDLDNDGKKEFVIRRDTGDVWTSIFDIYESTTGNNFNNVHTIQVPESTSSYYLGDAGDSDGDILSELIVYGFTSSDFYTNIYESASSTTYPNGLVWQSPRQDWWQVGAKIADTDNDGKKETVVAGQLKLGFIHAIDIYENTGDNSYQLIYSQGFSDIDTSQSMEVADDLDNDGKVEILFGGITQDRSKIYMVENTGDNSYQQIWSTELTANDGQLINVEQIKFLGDLDNDGKKEFIAGGFKTILSGSDPYFDVYKIFETTLDNSFEEIYSIWVGSGLYDSAINKGDIDGDSREELIILTDTTRIYILKNIGDNTVQPIWYHSWTKPPTVTILNKNIGIGDFDNDLKDEIIFNEYTSGQVNTVIYESTSNKPPVANAGSDQTVTDNDGNGFESVILDGSGSTDLDGVIVAYEWKEGTTVLGTSATLTHSFSVAAHTVTLTVTDNGGLSSSDNVVITVNQAPVTDTVTIIKAQYKNKNTQLTVEANSNDPGAVLTVVGYGTMTKKGDKWTFRERNVPDPGATVTVTSSRGGSDTANVQHD